MSLVTQLQNLATRIATELKAHRTLINGNADDLSALTTTAKSNLVAAINEVAAGGGGGGAEIDDTGTSLSKVWSSSHTADQISGAVTDLLDGAPGALDTLKELADALGDDSDFAATMTTALGNRVRVDTAAQGLTSTQQGNARTNIDVYGKSEIGDPTTDFVATFEAGL